MSEEKEKKREKLADVAKKYNIAIERIVELLKKKGFEIDGRNPNARLNTEMVDLVQKEFAIDKKKREQAEERAAQMRSSAHISNRNQAAANRDSSRNLSTTTTVVEEVIETPPPAIRVTTRLATENETMLAANANNPIAPDPIAEKESKLSRLSAIASKLKASKQVENTNKTAEPVSEIKPPAPVEIEIINPAPPVTENIIITTPEVAEPTLTSENNSIPVITDTPEAVAVVTESQKELPTVSVPAAELITDTAAAVTVPEAQPIAAVAEATVSEAPAVTVPEAQLISTVDTVISVIEPVNVEPTIESKSEALTESVSTDQPAVLAEVAELELDTAVEPAYEASAPIPEKDATVQDYRQSDSVDEIPAVAVDTQMNLLAAEITPLVEEADLNPDTASDSEPLQTAVISTVADVEVPDLELPTDFDNLTEEEIEINEDVFTDADLDDYLSRFDDRADDEEDDFIEEPLIFEGPIPEQDPGTTLPTAEEEDKTTKNVQVIRASDHAPKLQGLTVTGFIDPSLLRSGRNRKEKDKDKDKDKDKELTPASHVNTNTAGDTTTGLEAEKAKRNKRKRKRKPATAGNAAAGAANQPNKTNTTNNNRQGNTNAGSANSTNNRNQNQNRYNNNSANRPQNRQTANNATHSSTHTGSTTGNNHNNRASNNNQQQRPNNTFATGNINRRSPQSKKFRRARIEEQRAKRSNQAASINENVNVLEVTEYLTANELATLMDVPVQQVISKCMELGLFVSINQRINSDVIQLIAEEFNFEVHFITAEEQAEIDEEDEDEELLQPRPPIVTVMGHVDHGKTSLLDHIRQSNVIAGEAGGITQHIGAYSVELPDGRKITFLDTPGHEAFTAMRARGAQVTDIVIIVIAADDQVMPQTREAINHAQAAGVPMVFAINKIDKPGANPEKIKEQLSMMNLLVEDWGGNYQCQEISAKFGKGVDELLEKVLLEAELLDLKANPNKPARGTVIESQLDRGRGIVTTILVQSGTLNVGDVILCNAYYGKVKAILDERQHRIKKAGPSMPVQILGLNGVPQAGDKFQVMEQERDAREIATKRQQQAEAMREKFHKVPGLNDLSARIQQGNLSQLNVIVKADVDGSVEALSDSLIKLSNNEVSVHIVLKAVGQITESDINLASVSNAFIIGFQVRPSPSARKLAEAMAIEIRLYSVIYDAINDVKAALEGLLQPKMEETIVGVAEVREIFKITKVGTVAGCMVTEGKINRNTPVRLIRDGVVVYSGNILNLRRFKEDVREVAEGFECGISIENYNDIKVGDMIEAYTEIEIKRTLS
jgi:translation initiation factor IF-2